MKLSLKESNIEGLGVFTEEHILANINIESILFDKNDSITKNLDDMTEFELIHCVAISKIEGICAKDSKNASIGWFLNHSENNNIDLKKFITNRNIEIGEELTINYKQLSKYEEINLAQSFISF